MGLPMACNLLKAGFEVNRVSTYVRNDSIFLKVKEDLGRKSIGELGPKTRMLFFVMVMTGKQVAEIILGDNGLLKSMRPGFR